MYTSFLDFLPTCFLLSHLFKKGYHLLWPSRRVSHNCRLKHVHNFLAGSTGADMIWSLRGKEEKEPLFTGQWGREACKYLQGKLWNNKISTRTLSRWLTGSHEVHGQVLSELPWIFKEMSWTLVFHQKQVLRTCYFTDPNKIFQWTEPVSDALISSKLFCS